MSWITAIWSTTAVIGLTLARVHFVVWVKPLSSLANLLFGIAATSVVPCVAFEMTLMRTRRIRRFGEVLHRVLLPITLLVVLMIRFVRQNLRTARRP